VSEWVGGFWSYCSWARLCAAWSLAAQLYFTADAPTSRFFRSWDLDLVFDVLQVGQTVCLMGVGCSWGFLVVLQLGQVVCCMVFDVLQVGQTVCLNGLVVVGGFWLYCRWARLCV
jgi:hypothetical protein